jgi:hypothetical protein
MSGFPDSHRRSARARGLVRAVAATAMPAERGSTRASTREHASGRVGAGARMRGIGAYVRRRLPDERERRAPRDSGRAGADGSHQKEAPRRAGRGGCLADVGEARRPWGRLAPPAQLGERGRRYPGRLHRRGNPRIWKPPRRRIPGHHPRRRSRAGRAKPALMAVEKNSRQRFHRTALQAAWAVSFGVWMANLAANGDCDGLRLGVGAELGKDVFHVGGGCLLGYAQ